MSEILSQKQLAALVKDLRYSAANPGVSFAAIEARQGLLIAQFAAIRLALDAATREAEEERRTAEAAVKFLGRIAEVTWEAGLPSGDREQTLKNVRALVSRPAPPADAAREAVRYWTFQTEWGDGYRPAAVLFQTERIASLVREQNVRLELNVGPVIAVDVPLAALSSPAPAPSAKETKP